MIFAHTHEQVLAGTQTQTRRLWKDKHGVGGYVRCEKGFANAAIKNGCRTQWRLDRTYAVQPGRGKRAVGRIRVTGLRVERVQAITEADAQAEGVDSVQAYAALWDAIHSKRGERWSDNPLVVVIQFELVKE